MSKINLTESQKRLTGIATAAMIMLAVLFSNNGAKKVVTAKSESEYRPPEVKHACETLIGDFYTSLHAFKSTDSATSAKATLKLLSALKANNCGFCPTLDL